jgi:hypothetical protein
VSSALVLSILLYAGLFVTFVALVALFVPFRPFRWRRRAAVVAAASISFAVVVANIPSPRVRVGGATQSEMLIDRFMPEFDYYVRHETVVHASRADVFRAIEEVRPSEIRLFLLLTSIRRLKPASRDAEPEPPLLEVSKGGGFIELARAEDREIVQGTVGQFWRMRAARPNPPIRDAASFAAPHPGFAKATINFVVVEEGDGARVITETRILCPDRAAKARFTPYWRAIYPGSALIRVMWLDAIKQKSELKVPPAPQIPRSRSG